MNLQQMKCVVAVAESGSFSKAAKRLYLSQPSISAIIKELETELGVTIFERSNRGVTMTMPGAQLLKLAQQMLECEENIRETFTADAQRRTAVFSVASQHYPFVGSAMVALIRETDAKNYRFHLRETETTSILAGVASCRDDIGVLSVGKAGERKMLRTLKDNGLQYEVLFSGTPRVFMSAKHPLANRASVRQEELAAYPCIIYEQKDNVLFPFAEETTLPEKNADRILNVSDLYTSGAFMLGLNAYNIGTGLMPLELDDRLAAPLLEGGAQYTTGFVTRRGVPLTPIAQKFLATLKETLRAEYGMEIE